MPMKLKFVCKLTWRSIQSFFGRYMALLFIVMLSVGFFGGLKITKDAMADTCQNYLDEQHFYDFRLFSTLGFSKDDVNSFLKLDSVALAEGGKSIDAMMEYGDETSVFKLFALPQKINLPSLTAGRMPVSKDECVVDAKAFDKGDIGTVIRIDNKNDKGVTQQLLCQEFTIVGLVDSPLYLNNDRGTTTIGSGAIDGFLYISDEVFAAETYTEINLTLQENARIYSEEYEELIAGNETDISNMLGQLAQKRYEDLLAGEGLTPETGKQVGIQEAETYVLTRTENTGYVSFENDTSIISGVANIFPIFFILIAMLVCITTMTRMVDEERTQIGVLKAMGFGSAGITAKYLLYAASATVIGWAAGFFLGTWGLPQIFWFSYKSFYDFAPMSYLFSPYLALLTLAVSLIGILGSTWISCRRELGSEPAKLIRPRTTKTGKRILLERITLLWSRLSFLQKITTRNMFRYKRRLIMMLVGISCCTGLVVTAFGVRDSMIDIGTLQYEEVQRYDIEASFTTGAEDAVCKEVDKMSEIEHYLSCSILRVDLYGEQNMNSVHLLSFENTKNLSDFWNLATNNEALSFPREGEAIVGYKIAQKLSLSVGDTFEMKNADMQSLKVTVSGIFDNYVNNYVMISDDTYMNAFGEWEANTLLITTGEDSQSAAEKLTNIDAITSITRLSHSKETVDSALSCLNYLIWLIVLFSGALAFIVIFNLTNINLAERSREIATVEVLGFYPKETESYVLRENLILSVLAGFIGLPLGTLFHSIVMHMVVIDMMSFDIHITPVSYVLAFICTIIFAVVVNLFMKRQITKIKMAESLKAVE